MTASSLLQVVIPSNVLAQELGGELVLLNMENETYYSLNKVGSRMWQFLAEKGDIETATQQLLQIFAVEESTLRQDVAKLIDELVQEGLLSIASSQENQ
ncbi:PqqD family protein [Aerosakkonema funiforme]|uniref:PqqD family protein n=1 Tax=Aerosakkonema funiforme TaxID=1246630 RepID=UPI0035B6B19C